MSQKRTLKRFERQHSSKVLWGDNFSEKFLLRFGLLDSLKGLGRNSLVLDYGAGTGRLTPFLVNQGFSVTNLEPTQSRSRVKDRLTKEDFLKVALVSDSENLVPKSFDAVVSIGVIHHVSNPKDLISDMLRLCKEGGFVSFWVYRRQNIFIQKIIEILRLALKRAPHSVLLFFSTMFSAVVFLQSFSAKNSTLGLEQYTFRNLNLMVYDQLSPPLSTYFRTFELIDLLQPIGLPFVITEVGSGINVTIRKKSS
jgi:SAM-dependent methyltransferase